MATIIKITPTIQGSDSIKFNKNIASSKSNKIPENRKNKMFELVNKVISKNSK